MQAGQELQDPGLRRVVLAEGLEVPAHEDQIAPGLPDPLGVALRLQRPTLPFAISEPVADVVREVVMAGQQRHRLPRIAIDVSRVAFAKLPAPAFGEGGPEPAGLEREINL